MQTIEQLVRERNAMLRACDVDKMIEFHAKNNPTAAPFPSREVAEIALHKMRTATKGLSLGERLYSARWLRERDYCSEDDGDLM